MASSNPAKSSRAQIVQAAVAVSALFLGIIGYFKTVEPLYQLSLLRETEAMLKKTSAGYEAQIKEYRTGMRPFVIGEYTKKVLIDAAGLLVAAKGFVSDIQSGTGSSSWRDTTDALDLYAEEGIITDLNGLASRMVDSTVSIVGMDVLKEHLKGSEMTLLDSDQRTQLSKRILELAVPTGAFDTVLTFRRTVLPVDLMRSFDKLTPDELKTRRSLLEAELKRVNDAHVEFIKAVFRMRGALLLP